MNNGKRIYAQQLTSSAIGTKPVLLKNLREKKHQVRERKMSGTETFQYTHFKSCHSPGVKKGFVKGEGLRLLRTNSSEETFVENIRLFKLRLRARGYPYNLIDKTLSQVKSLTERKLSRIIQECKKKYCPL